MLKITQFVYYILNMICGYYILNMICVYKIQTTQNAKFLTV